VRDSLRLGLLFGEIAAMKAQTTARQIFAGALLVGTGALTGCASFARSPDSYTAREFDVEALLVELQGIPRASTSVITASDIRNLPTGYTVEEVLAHSAGIYLRRDQRPGGEMTVFVLGAADPLFVVDGVPMEPDGYIPISSQDIERIEMHKYGAGTALYGLRGSNGVIVITTKR
jgi:TonB-dependent SusC/RagA subfamily outer membrane receptor